MIAETFLIWVYYAEWERQTCFRDEPPNEPNGDLVYQILLIFFTFKTTTGLKLFNVCEN